MSSTNTTLTFNELLASPSETLLRTCEERVHKWNDDRGLSTTLSMELETAMLEEEVGEVFKATEPASLIHEMADCIFVMMGTDRKMQLHLEAVREKEGDVAGIEKALHLLKVKDMLGKAVSLAAAYTIARFHEFYGESAAVLTPAIFHHITIGALYLVCNANDLKPAVTNSEGKGVKGDAYISPIGAIKDFMDVVEEHYGLVRC